MTVSRLLLAVALLGSFAPLLPALTIDFSDVNTATAPGPAQTYSGPGGGVFYNGSDSAGGFSSGGAHFTNYYSSDYGSWSGWAYSTTHDATTPGFSNQYSAFPGPRSPDAAYGVAYVSDYDGPTVIALPSGADAPLSLTLTNTTYAVDSMRNGDGFAKKFGGASGNDADWFLLTITGLDSFGGSPGTVDFYLADYRSADNDLDYIVTDWTDVDLTSLGSGVQSLEFTLSSSDSGDFGINTPAYFALAGLTAVPEPSTYAMLLGTGALAFVCIGRRRSRQ